MLDYPDFSSKGATPCSSTDPDAFFPDPDVMGSVRLGKSALKVCEDCPYIAECFAWAFAHGEAGIWGGTTAADRNRMRKRMLKTGQDPIIDRAGHAVTLWAGTGS